MHHSENLQGLTSPCTTRWARINGTRGITYSRVRATRPGRPTPGGRLIFLATSTTRWTHTAVYAPNMDTTNAVPKRGEIINRISAHRSELQKMGVRSLALFGSVARDSADAQSDIDVLVDLPPMSLFSITRIEHYLTDLLGRKADLVPRDSIRPQLKVDIEAGAVDVL